MTRIEQAQQFAHEAHDSINQRRKYSGQPYWVHTDEVAAMVASTPDTTENMVVAAHLHDVLEDVTPINPRFYNRITIMTHFGVDVCHMVEDLTDVFTKKDYPKWNRAKRHENENLRLSAINTKSKTIKLADLICNTRDITAQDPDFARVYLREKLALLPLLLEGSPILWERAYKQATEGMKTLGMDLHVINTK